MRNAVVFPGVTLGAALALAILGGAALSSSGCSSTDPDAIDCTGALPIPGMNRAANCTGPLIVYAADAMPTTTTTSSADATTTTQMTTGADAATTDTDADDDAATTVVVPPEFTGDTFDGTQAPGTGDNSFNASHNFDAGSENPYGQYCQSCHMAGAGASGDPWTIAGSIAKGDAGGAPYSAPVEVRVIGPDGGVIASAYSDSLGNFWAESASAVVPAGSMAAIRTATSTEIMAQTISSGGCNNVGGCHGTSGYPGHIYIP